MNRKLHKDLHPEQRYSGHCASGTVVKVTRLLPGNGANLNTVTFSPPVDLGHPPIVFVSGFASVIENFTELLIALTENYTVHYVETRDKASSIIPKNAGFSMNDITSDISGSLDMLDVESGKYILLTYSLGATASAQAFNLTKWKKPALFVMVEPNAKFRIPKFFVSVARYFSWCYYLIRPLLKLYIKTFHINIREDYEMYRIILRTLDSADSRKLASTVREIINYEIWDSLDKIDVPVLIIGASRDKFHTLQDAVEISSGIRNSKYVDLCTNKRTHGAEVFDIIMNYPVSFLYLILTGSALLTLFL